MNRKYIIITSIVIIVLVLYFITINKENTIEEILKINFDDISYIKVGKQKENYSIEKFKSEFKDKKFKKVKMSLGNTTHRYYVCYDKDNQVIFTVVSIGNKNLYFIKKGIFNVEKDNYKLYQMIK